MVATLRAATIVACFAVVSAAFGARPDVVIADFEGNDYDGWTTTGEAFGTGPAHATLPGQMPVSGYDGKGWVSSFTGGDRTTGTLTSPEFALERDYVVFLIGGGGWETTCLNLIVDGKVVRTANGPNTQPGGSEALEPQAWDVRDLAGRRGRLEAVDRATGGWGHINIDHILQSDTRPATPVANPERSLVVEKRYVNFPVRNDAPVRKLTMFVDGVDQPTIDIRLADAEPQWWASLDAGAWRGKTLTARVDRLRNDSRALESITQSDQALESGDLYRERLRPQFHFSSRRGWLNDPNGLVFYKGEYHLFYQHNPYGWDWGNMHWGHAVSSDLVHWRELGDALAPDRLGPMFSGSAVVDWKNTTGFGKGGEPPMVLIYTAAGNPAVQCLAYTTDGRTFTKYAGNPVVPQITGGNRDPKVLWHEPTQRWVMVLYVALPGKPASGTKDRPRETHTVHVLTSPDLKTWTVQGHVDGFYECPDLFDLPTGRGRQKEWLLSAADTNYMLGQFDGQRFTPESALLTGQRGASFYAPQTFSDLPGGRRVQIGWGRMPSPGMPFNQMMCFPCDLSLRSPFDNLRLRWWPVKEIETLRAKNLALSRMPRRLKPGDNPLKGIRGELLDISAEFVVDDAKEVGLAIAGTEVVYDAEKGELACKDKRASLFEDLNGAVLGGYPVRIRVLVDRTSLEVFGDDGVIYMPMANLPSETDNSLAVFARGGSAILRELEAYELRPIWPANQ